MIKVEYELSALKFSQSLKPVLKQELQRQTLKEVTELKKRTASGKSVDGFGFKPYSPQYEKRKRNSGRKTRPVDLTYSGAMLRSIQTKVEDNGKRLKATVFFGSAKEAAKAKGNQETRDFFGFSEEQFERIKDSIAKKIADSIK